jgi:hypothetical protein
MSRLAFRKMSQPLLRDKRSQSGNSAGIRRRKTSSCRIGFRNPKHEIRNPKVNPNLKEDKSRAKIARWQFVSSFFEFLIPFGFRASNIGFHTREIR